jgi:hypothetical protein
MIIYSRASGWKATPIGPADLLGTDSRYPTSLTTINLPGGSITLDVLGAPRVTEVFVAESDVEGVPSLDADPWLRTLFGFTGNELINGNAGPPLLAVAGPIIAAIADAEQLRCAGASPALSTLLFAHALKKLDLESDANEEITQASRAVVACSRYIAARPDAFMRMSEIDRTRFVELLESALTLESVSEHRHLRGSYDALLANLALPQVVSGLERMLHAHLEDLHELSYAGATAVDPEDVVDISSYWQPEELRTGLGDAAAELFAGVAIRGSWPGRATAAFSLKAGADTHLGTLIARIYSWKGRLLGESEFEVSPTTGLPRASFAIEIDSDSSADSSNGVFLELSQSPHRILHPHEFPRLAHLRSVRLARDSVELRAVGELDAAAEAWRSAIGLAELFTSRPPQDWPGELPGDCIRAFVTAWRGDSRDLLDETEGATPEVRASALVPILRDLGRAVAVCEEVAEAYEECADALSQADDSDLTDDADGYRLDALNLCYLLRDARGATRVLGKMARQVRPDA